MVWLVWGFLVLGFTYAVVGASIFTEVRMWAYSLLGRFGSLGNRARGVLACGPCASFWVGLVLGIPDSAVLAHVCPWALSSPLLVSVTSHIVGAFLAMGVVSTVQFATKIPMAEIARKQEAEQYELSRASGEVNERAKKIDLYREVTTEIVEILTEYTDSFLCVNVSNYYADGYTDEHSFGGSGASVVKLRDVSKTTCDCDGDCDCDCNGDCSDDCQCKKDEETDGDEVTS